MRKLSFVGVMVLVMGCWRGGSEPVKTVAAPTPVRPQAEANLAMMSLFRDRMCECENRPCLDGVQAAMSEWVERKMAEPAAYAPPPSEETLERITMVGLAMSECASRLLAPQNDSGVIYR
ncbi:MAG: hypothetical protein SFX73_29350 [Kofleriaceae bacterium]|nr:hypothetical protein [Kofleriaceae bacterium]